MKNFNSRVELLLSMQKALLGEITPNIRGITCGCNESEIIIKCYFNNEISEEEKEAMECVATEVIACFPNQKINLECKRIDFPEPLMPYKLSEWVYLRKE